MIDVMAELKPIGELYKRKEFAAALIALEELWNSITNPKVDVLNAYMIVEYGAKINLEFGDLEAAWRWAGFAPRFSQVRTDIGEAEFLVGRVAFERGDLVTAKEQFSIANRKSRGRMFVGENLKFRVFVKSCGWIRTFSQFRQHAGEHLQA